MYPNLDPLRDEQEAPPVDICRNHNCQGEVYKHETMFFYEGVWLCPDCFKAEIERILEKDPRTLANALSLDMKRYI